jgi:hypothetical protein
VQNIDFTKFDPTHEAKILREKIQTEKLHLSQNMISHINTILTSSSSSLIVDTCFTLVEVEIFKRMSNVLNAAYVNYFNDKANSEKLLEASDSAFGHIENMLRHRKSQRGNGYSMGVYLDGVRQFSKDDIAQNLLSPLQSSQSMSWKKKLSAKTYDEFFLVRLEKSLLSFKLAGQKYSIPPQNLEVFIRDREVNLRQGSTTWDSLFSAIVEFRNAKAHHQSSANQATTSHKPAPWWHSNETFTQIIRSYLEPAVLQLILHPSLQCILRAERVTLTNELNHQFSVKRLSSHPDLNDPNAFIPKQEQQRNVLRSGMDVWVSLTSPHQKSLELLFECQDFPTPAHDDQLFDYMLECLITLFYINDGVIKSDERYILDALAQKRSIKDVEDRINRCLTILDQIISVEVDATNLKVMFIENFSWFSSHFEDIKAECKRLCEILINEQDNEAISLKDMESRVENLTKQTLDELCTDATRTRGFQYSAIREKLQDSYILSITELSEQLGLPETIIKKRIDEMLNLNDLDRATEMSIGQDQESRDFEVVRYNVANDKIRYRLKDAHKIKQFADILEEIQGQVKTSPPAYIERLLKLCAFYIRNEDDKEIWIQRVDQLLRTYKANEGRPEILIEWGSKRNPTFSIKAVNVEKLLSEVMVILGQELKSYPTGQYFRYRSDQFILTIDESGSRIYNPPLRATDFAYLLGRIVEGGLNQSLERKLPSNKNRLSRIELQSFEQDQNSNNSPLTKLSMVEVKEINLRQTFDPHQQTYRGGKSRLHFKLRHIHNEVEYFIYVRADSLTALYANVLYSLNITKWHFNPETEELIQKQGEWLSTNGESLNLEQSIWAKREYMLHSNWPILTGRVRYLFNIAPYHSNERPFDVPIRFLLGEEFDDQGTLSQPPMEYYFEMQGSTDEKVDQLNNLCKTLGVNLERLEYYPTIRFNMFNVKDHIIELNPHQEFLDLLSLLVRSGYRPVDSAVYHDSSRSLSDETGSNIDPKADTHSDTDDTSSTNRGWLYPGHESKASHGVKKYLIASSAQHPKGISFEDYEVIEEFFYVDKAALHSEFSFELITYTLTTIFNLSEGIDQDYTLHYRTYEEMEQEELKRRERIQIEGEHGEPTSSEIE